MTTTSIIFSYLFKRILTGNVETALITMGDEISVYKIHEGVDGL